MSRAVSHPAPRDQGAVTAELAIGMLGLTIVLACLLSVVRVAVVHLQVQDAAGAAARAQARGESPGVARAVVDRLAGPATMTLSSDGTFTTVTVQRHVALLLPGAPSVSVSATATSLTEELP